MATATSEAGRRRTVLDPPVLNALGVTLGGRRELAAAHGLARTEAGEDVGRRDAQAGLEFFVRLPQCGVEAGAIVVFEIVAFIEAAEQLVDLLGTLAGREFQGLQT